MGDVTPSNEPLPYNEVRALGYRVQGARWILLNPDAKPDHRAGLCKACRKFDAHPDWEGLCAGCMYFGRGDPHGLGRKRLRERLRARSKEAAP